MGVDLVTGSGHVPPPGQAPSLDLADVVSHVPVLGQVLTAEPPACAAAVAVASAKPFMRSDRPC